MSDAIYPTLPGLTFDVTRSPEFKTVVNTAVSGRESRISQWSAPRWHYELIYEILRDSYGELEELAGFFLSRQGSFDDFLFADPDDAPVSDQLFGGGDGATTAFQVVRTYGGFVEPVRGLTSAPVVSVGGVVTADFTWTTDGLVTFASPPAAGALLRWSGPFLRRVRFDGDQMDLTKFMGRLWEAKSVKLVSVK